MKYYYLFFGFLLVTTGLIFSDFEVKNETSTEVMVTPLGMLEGAGVVVVSPGENKHIPANGHLEGIAYKDSGEEYGPISKMFSTAENVCLKSGQCKLVVKMTVEVEGEKEEISAGKQVKPKKWWRKSKSADL